MSGAFYLALWEAINVSFVVWEYVSEVRFNQSPQPQSITQKINHSMFLSFVCLCSLGGNIHGGGVNITSLKGWSTIISTRKSKKKRERKGRKEWLKKRLGTEGREKTQCESQKVKVEMFTWDSSGCMGKECKYHVLQKTYKQIERKGRN